ncbi:MAG: hypothetical protein AB1571_00620 [Nanoarchaeota archaeon]
MDKGLIQKNLYDLEYNKVLNLYNITMVLIGTLIISIILSNYDQNTKVLTIFFSGLLSIYFRHIFNKELENIKGRMKTLK